MAHVLTILNMDVQFAGFHKTVVIAIIMDVQLILWYYAMMPWHAIVILS